MSKINHAEFRSALGSFPTGVTVVTARGPDGRDVGVTANSFNSVSLNPPMVLWSINKDSASLASFISSGTFAVHILAADQQAVSDRFAARWTERFADLEIERGYGEAPLLSGCAARFQCRLVYRYEGGDHEILVGEVIRFDRLDKAPLVYHGGRYGTVGALCA